MRAADPNQAPASPPARLFIAVDLPEAVRVGLAGLKEKAPSLKWGSWAHLHLTLNFIGTTPAELAGRIRASLRQVEFAPFSLELSGLGCFERRAGTILWAGLAAAGPLMELKRKIDRALAGDGLITEQGRFSPHITLARFKKRPGLDLRDFVAKYGSLANGAFGVEDFVLYQSDLRPTGAVHRAWERYPARGGETRPA